MTIHQQHRNQYLNYYAVLALMAMALFTITLAAAELSGSQPRTYKFELRLASLKEVKGWESFRWKPVPGDVPGTVWISPEVSLTNADVAQAQPDWVNGKFSVALLLNEEGALKLARLTMAHIGGFLAIMIDDRFMSVQRIADEIINGQVRLDGITDEEAASIAEGIMVR